MAGCFVAYGIDSTIGGGQAGMTPNKTCSIIIPVYNEEDILEETIKRIHQCTQNSALEWRVIVVDDGSSDGSSEIALRCLGNPDRYIRHPRCQGKASAIITGIQSCDTDYVLFSDADMSVPPEFFETAVMALASSDIVIASRHVPGARLIHRQPWLREKCGEIFRRIVRMFLLKHVSDFTCGMKAYRLDVARKLYDHLTCRDWTFDVEVLLRADVYGMSVVEIPVDWNNRPNSRVHLFSAIIGSLRSLIRMFMIYKRKSKTNNP